MATDEEIAAAVVLLLSLTRPREKAEPARVERPRWTSEERYLPGRNRRA
ncbi:acyl-CoA carboxylase subunit epsilon [Nonomuraea jabiensis]